MQNIFTKQINRGTWFNDGLRFMISTTYKMFCENCKQFTPDCYAKYCPECGSKLIDTHNIFLEKKNLTIQWLAQFLRETLGYAIVEEIGDSCIRVQYRLENHLTFDGLYLAREANFISIFTFASITRCVSEDLRFYKAINEANKNSNIFLHTL